MIDIPIEFLDRDIEDQSGEIFPEGQVEESDALDDYYKNIKNKKIKAKLKSKKLYIAS